MGKVCGSIKWIDNPYEISAIVSASALFSKYSMRWKYLPDYIDY